MEAPLRDIAELQDRQDRVLSALYAADALDVEHDPDLVDEYLECVRRLGGTFGENAPCWLVDPLMWDVYRDLTKTNSIVSVEVARNSIQQILRNQ